jgi:hypothetical protein
MMLKPCEHGTKEYLPKCTLMLATRISSPKRNTENCLRFKRWEIWRCGHCCLEIAIVAESCFSFYKISAQPTEGFHCCNNQMQSEAKAFAILRISAMPGAILQKAPQD